ncbi:ShlB/FhaC/HecB family hemolysin secretion/activation protein [Devosia nitrariae]|nr:ShlB/FhaC/HecB family hemolysin secretion/activation protein [Devosia nitrariae]
MGRQVVGEVLSAALLALLCASSSLAQTASQVTPDFEPQRTGTGQALVFSGAPGLRAPEGAEALVVALANVVVEGGKPELEQQTAQIRAALTGRRVSVAEIFERARDLEAAYADAGYVLVRVVVPAQTLNDGGTLRLTVVDGFLERLDAQGVPEPVRSRVVALVEPLLRRPDVTLAEIERRLLLAGDTPGVALRTALASGAEPGGAVLVVSADFDPVMPFIAIDNTLPKSLGTWSVTAGLDINNFFNSGEVLYFRAVGHPRFNGDDDLYGIFDDDPQYRSLTAGGIVPLGNSGLAFNLEGTLTQTTPESTLGIQTSSRFERLSARLDYPLVRSRALDLNVGLVFDVQNEYQDLITGVGDFGISEDRLRILRLTGDGAWSSDFGLLTAAATLSFGLDALGARSADDATPGLPLSRQGADATFQKLELELGYYQTLAPHLAVSVSGKAQTSFGDPLLRSEQIGIASLDELSTFDAGSLTGDSGWVVRAEASAPFDISTGAINLVASPYVFGAIGNVYLEQPTVLEEAEINASSLGLGVRFGASDGKDISSTLTLEYGRAFRDDRPDDDRFTLVGSMRF